MRRTVFCSVIAAMLVASTGSAENRSTANGILHVEKGYWLDTEAGPLRLFGIGPSTALRDVLQSIDGTEIAVQGLPLSPAELTAHQAFALPHDKEPFDGSAFLVDLSSPILVKGRVEQDPRNPSKILLRVSPKQAVVIGDAFQQTQMPPPGNSPTWAKLSIEDWVHANQPRQTPAQAAQTAKRSVFNSLAFLPGNAKSNERDASLLGANVSRNGNTSGSTSTTAPSAGGARGAGTAR